MTASASTALTRARAKVGHSNRVGYCLAEIRALYDIPSRYGDASTAWANAVGKHTSTPPPGAPVFWTGGSHGHGHIAIMDVGGYIISTDAPSNGRWGRVPLSWPAQRWGHRYVGWAEGFNGARIPGLPPAAATVRLADLHYGMRDSNSVKALQAALNRHNLSPDLPVTGNFLDQTDAAVRLCQQRHGYGHDAPKHAFVGRQQAVHLGLNV